MSDNYAPWRRRSPGATTPLGRELTAVDAMMALSMRHRERETPSASDRQSDRFQIRSTASSIALGRNYAEVPIMRSLGGGARAGGLGVRGQLRIIRGRRGRREVGRRRGGVVGGSVVPRGDRSHAYTHHHLASRGTTRSSALMFRQTLGAPQPRKSIRQQPALNRGTKSRTRKVHSWRAGQPPRTSSSLTLLRTGRRGPLHSFPSLVSTAPCSADASGSPL